MGKYTAQLRSICESKADLREPAEYADINEIIAKARLKIFDFSYPIFDNEYKAVLETKILKHYYTREIGAETYGLWKLWLDAKLNEIMPYYNKMYETTLLEFDPLTDTDITTTHQTDGTRNGNGSSNNNSSGSGESWNHYSDTPQGGVEGLASMTYLTNATHTTDDTSSQSATTYTDASTTTENYLQRVKGNSGSRGYATLIKEARETFINVDMMIIEELSDLFLNLW